jgi:transposase-like protein
MSQEIKSERKRLTEEVAERLVTEYGLTPDAVFGPGGLMKELSRAVLERVLEGELTHHLGYARGGRRKEAVEAGAEMEVGEREERGRREGWKERRSRRRTAATARRASG